MLLPYCLNCFFGDLIAILLNIACALICLCHVRFRSNLELELDQRGGSPCLSLPASIQHKKKCTCKFLY